MTKVDKVELRCNRDDDPGVFTYEVIDALKKLGLKVVVKRSDEDTIVFTVEQN